MIDMMYEKIIWRYFKDVDDYTEDPDNRLISFILSGNDFQDDPEFETNLREMSHFMEPWLITHRSVVRAGNGGCGDPDCCGYNYNNYTIAVVLTGVRFSEGDPHNPVVKIEKLEEVDYT